MSKRYNPHNLTIQTSPQTTTSTNPNNPQSADSSGSAASSAPTPHTKKKMNDVLSKECVGLPVFISSGETITSDNTSGTSSRRESMLSPKRLSMAFDFAITSLDSIYKHAQTLLTEDPPRNQPRRDDLESGGLAEGERRFGEESYRDWLD